MGFDMKLHALRENSLLRMIQVEKDLFFTSLFMTTYLHEC